MPNGKIAADMPTETSQPAEAPVRRRLFTAEEYHRLGEVGILHEEERVELVDGDIVVMSPIGTRHASCVDRLVVLMHRCFGDRGILRVQGPVRLDPFSEPQPDLTVLKPRADFYSSAHPQGEDILLAIEVADTSLRFDRDVKGRVYARTAVAEFWLVDLPNERIEMFSQPGIDGYQSCRVLKRGERLPIAALPDAVLSVDEVLG